MSHAAGRIDSHRDLVVWQKAMRLAEACCRRASRFPPGAFELARHVQKTAVSIPSNIAEGHELRLGSFRQHLRIALGSVAELDTQLDLASRLGWLEIDAHRQLNDDLQEVRRMLRTLEAVLHRRLMAGRALKDA